MGSKIGSAFKKKAWKGKKAQQEKTKSLDTEKLLRKAEKYLFIRKTMKENVHISYLSEHLRMSPDELTMLLKKHPDTFKYVGEDDWTTVKKHVEWESQERVKSKFIFDSSELLRDELFSNCKLSEDVFACGLFLPQRVDVKDGKGNVVGTAQEDTAVLITSDGKIIEAFKKLEADYKVRIKTVPYHLPLRWDLESVKGFTDGKAKKVNPKKMFESIREQYKKFLYFINDAWYDVHALWDIGTYLFMLFNVYPLLELRGVSGSAKTKVMKVSNRMTMNPTDLMINPSEATLFRETHDKRPTKYIDEAEKIFIYNPKTRQIDADLRAELINSSYSKGSVVPRQEKVGERWITVAFHTYSPTAIGSIRGLFGATEDRALTHVMTKAPDNDSRGELEVEDHESDPSWQHIRNSLHIFALQYWKEIEKGYRGFNEETGIKRRDLQLWKPLLVLAKIIDPAVFERVKSFAKAFSTQRAADFIPEGTLDYLILKTVAVFVQNRAQRIHTKDIYDNLKLDVDPGMKPRTISNRMDNLGFKEMRHKDQFGSYFEIPPGMFETVVSPICPDIVKKPIKESSESSESSELDINKIKEPDESGKKHDEPDESELTKLTNLTKMTVGRGLEERIKNLPGGDLSPEFLRNHGSLSEEEINRAVDGGMLFSPKPGVFRKV